MDNSEVVILLGVERTNVCNPHFLLEQTRLKARSSFLEATWPQMIKGHAMEQAPEGTEMSPPGCPHPYLCPKVPFHPGSQQCPPTDYSREDKEAKLRAPV